MSKPIFELVDELPEDGVTVRALQALDFVVPGEWENLVGFDNTIKAVARTTDESRIQKIGERAVHLYNDSSQGYQTAIWLYQTVDTTDKALGTAALANKVGEQFSLLSFLSWLTPKADNAQAIDLSLKLVVEIVAFCKVNGLPGDSIGDFVQALGKYEKENLMRMSAPKGNTPSKQTWLVLSSQPLSNSILLDWSRMRHSKAFASIFRAARPKVS